LFTLGIPKCAAQVPGKAHEADRNVKRVFNFSQSNFSGSKPSDSSRIGLMNKSIDDAIANPVTYSTPGAYDEILTQVRHEDPVHWTEPEGYRPFWTVSKHSDILEIERQNDKFLNSPRFVLASIAEEQKIDNKPPLRMIINMDSPDHRVHRDITQTWFLPPNLRKLEAGLAALATEFVDRMEALGGSCDFVKDVAVWYPLRVIMTILGVPREDDHKMLRLSQALFGSQDPERAGTQDSVTVRQAAIAEFFSYFNALSEERRKNPTEDLATVIANAQLHGEPIGMFEQMSYYVIVASAGHDTTSSTVSGGLLALMQNPSELAKLRGNLALVPSAVEEMLRWVTPVKYFFRTATVDYELRGKKIKAGDSLMMCYQSANRDEEVFPDPFSFKIDRTPNKHLAFGHGTHLCLGLHLARMEMTALYRELLSRVDRLDFAGDPDWVLSSFVVGLKQLPIHFAMRQKAA
jgi:cytochrome P450